MLGSTIYTIARVGLTVAMLHPQIRLAEKIYSGFISPYLMKNEERIDKKIEKMTEKARDKFDQVEERAKKEYN